MWSILSFSREERVQHRTGNCRKQELYFDTCCSSIIRNLSHAYLSDQVELSDLSVSTFFWKALVMIFFSGHVFDSLTSCRPIRECLRVKRFIPRQTPAKGSRRSPVHHRRTYRFGARFCSKVLCYLAYFSFFSNGASSKLKLQLRAHGGQREVGVKPTSQRENCLPCQGRGPPRPEWHTEQMTGTWVLANRGMDELIQEKEAGLCCPGLLAIYNRHRTWWDTSIVWTSERRRVQAQHCKENGRMCVCAGGGGQAGW